ncbi:hypothetical protein M2118_000566 [Aurantimicrobium minutum]|uniref:hypothetical protein n=1 Tax=Aurantimicrobium minutum TaxID=708131 RepID=UPI00247506A2|nr:hypothetical protein [Aurantimicrobium minutum]MDH6277603.1 hypothetical protein [Aurantimicrobium minutum]
MTVMTDPMIAARGILTLISQTVDEEDLTLAHESLDYGYPRSAVYYGVAAARQAEAPIAENIRQLIIHEFAWPEAELKDVMDLLEHIPLQAA